MCCSILYEEAHGLWHVKDEQAADWGAIGQFEDALKGPLDQRIRGHSALAISSGGYFPGVATAPVLVGVSAYLAIKLTTAARL